MDEESPNQTVASYGYDDLSRLTSLSHKHNGTVIADFGYTHDQVGNIKTVTGSREASYNFDEIYRLLNVTSARAETFTYDDVGNRKTGPGPLDTGYLYNDANQITQGPNMSCTYDNQGNQTTRYNTGAPWTLQWDYENRLIKMEKIDGTEQRVITYKYDPFGRRIEKKVSNIIGHSVTGETSYYVYDGEDIIREIKQICCAGDLVTSWFVHGPGIDEPLAMEREEGTLRRRTRSWYYYHPDGLGSISAVSDANGNTVQSYEYDSFGNIVATSAPGFDQPYTYTGRELDKETGLYYYRARYYDPMEGRFISKDPIGFAGGDANLYGYVRNNPINYTDPMGLVSRCTSGLEALGGNSVGPLYHKYHCWIGGDGKRTCRGYGRDPGSGWLEAILGPVNGIILKEDDNKSYGKESCEEDNNNKCMDSCISSIWNYLDNNTPTYGWIIGVECKIVADTVYENCRKQCTHSSNR